MWQGAPNQEGDCPAESDCWLCTLPAGHPPIDGPSVHEAWGTQGETPIAVWIDGGPVFLIRAAEEAG